MSVKIQLHPGDNEMVEVYSIRVSNSDVFKKPCKVLWGVVHVDMLSELGIDSEALEAGEVELCVKGEEK